MKGFLPMKWTARAVLLLLLAFCAPWAANAQTQSTAKYYRPATTSDVTTSGTFILVNESAGTVALTKPDPMEPYTGYVKVTSGDLISSGTRYILVYEIEDSETGNKTGIVASTISSQSSVLNPTTGSYVTMDRIEGKTVSIGANGVIRQSDIEDGAYLTITPNLSTHTATIETEINNTNYGITIGDGVVIASRYYQYGMKWDENSTTSWSITYDNGALSITTDDKKIGAVVSSNGEGYSGYFNCFSSSLMEANPVGQLALYREADMRNVQIEMGAYSSSSNGIPEAGLPTYCAKLSIDNDGHVTNQDGKYLYNYNGRIDAQTVVSTLAWESTLSSLWHIQDYTTQSSLGGQHQTTTRVTLENLVSLGSPSSSGSMHNIFNIENGLESEVYGNPTWDPNEIITLTNRFKYYSGQGNNGFIGCGFTPTSGDYFPPVVLYVEEEVPCVAPTNVSASISIDGSSVLLVWADSEIGAWNVAYKEQGTSAWIQANARPIYDHTFALSNLSPGITYEYMVSSICGATPSTTGTFTMPCTAPTGLTVTTTENSATISWDDTGAPSYTVTYGSGATTQNETVLTNACSLSGLTPGTTYTYSVVANCSAASNSSAVTSTFTTATPSAPCTTVYYQKVTSARDITTTDSYILVYEGGAGAYPMVALTTTSNQTGRVAMAAASSSTLDPTTLPANAAILSAQGNASGCKLYYEDSNGSKYYLYGEASSGKTDWSTRTSIQWIASEQNGAVMLYGRFTITSASGGTEIVPRYQYNNNSSIGLSSSGDIVLYKRVQSMVAPTNLVVSNVTSTTAKLEWDDNCDPSGWQIVLMSGSAAGGGSSQTITNVPSHPYDLDNLTPETTYTVMVYNNYNGTLSSPVTTTFITPAAPCNTAPSNLSFGYVTNSTVKLNWTENCSATAWQIVYSTNSSFDPDAATPVAAGTNPFKLTGLNANTTYYAYVRSDNGDGTYTGWSNMVTFTTVGEITVDAQHLSYTYDFEDGIEADGWSVGPGWAASGASYNWGIVTGTNHTTGGSQSVFSGDATPYQVYLYLPEITISNDVSSVTLSFYSIGRKSHNNLERYTEDGTAGGEEVWKSEGVNNSPDWEEIGSIDLTQFKGQTINLWFVSSDGWYIDDVTITATVASPYDNIFTPATGNWNVAANWSAGHVPTSSENALINGDCTIPSGVVAQVNNITIGTPGGTNPNSSCSLTIADGGQLVHNNEGVMGALEKNITASNDDHPLWYAISSPYTTEYAVHQVSATLQQSLMDQDAAKVASVYKFDQSQELEWVYLYPGNDVIEPGRGYLYSSTNYRYEEIINDPATGTSYSMTSVAYPKVKFHEGTLRPSNTPFEYNLEYSEQNSYENLRGWNFVGNPFACNAVINRPCYVMEEIEATHQQGFDNANPQTAGRAVLAPCSAVFVAVESSEISQESPTPKVTFYREGAYRSGGGATGTTGMVNIAVEKRAMRGTTRVDKAIVSFREGDALPKLVLNPNKSKLYIPQNGKDYAIAVAQPMGVLPVNFEAFEDGNYTLSVTPEEAEFSYLHLIDNLTGADVDLLMQPAYTFEASMMDYPSRFKLVFSKSEASADLATDEPFAFYDGSAWVLATDGNATVQLVDVMGRVIRSTEGARTVSTNGMATGVYVLRLINGNDVKTQKIVVR